MPTKLEGLKYLQENPAVKNVVEIDRGKRVSFEVQIDHVKTHPKIKGTLRHKDPSDKDRQLLVSSMQKTDGALYSPSVYIGLRLPDANGSGSGESLEIYLVDGHQRLLAAKAAGHTSITVQWIVGWLSPEQAIEEAIGLNVARFEPNLDDIAAMIKGTGYTQKKIAELTGKSETTISRIAKVAAKPDLWKYYREGIVTLSDAVKLIDACEDSREKEEMLLSSLAKRYATASEKAKRKQEENQKSKTKLKKEDKEAAKVKHHMGCDWGTIIDTVESLDVVGGVAKELDLDRTTKAAAKVCTSASDWKNKLAVRDFFDCSRKIEAEEIKHVLEHLPYIQKNLELILDGKDPLDLDDFLGRSIKEEIATPPSPTSQAYVAHFSEDDEEELEDSSGPGASKKRISRRRTKESS